MLIINWNEKTNLISSKYECPSCGVRYHYGVPFVYVPCSKCGTKYRTDFHQDIYSKKAKEFLEAFAYNNDIKVIAEGKFQPYILQLHEHLSNLHCFVISDIDRSEKNIKYCKSCGVCYNCFTCKDCGRSFSKDSTHRKVKCPDCGSTSLSRTKFTGAVEANTHRRICPVCKSSEIALTRTPNKTKCHKCGSKDLTESRTMVEYSFTIERKPSDRIENN